MTIVNVVHVGLGLIGGTALSILRDRRDRWHDEFDIQLQHRAFIDTSGGVACDDPGGYSGATIDGLVAARRDSKKVCEAASGLGLTPRTASEALAIALEMGNVIVVDCAASGATASLSAEAIQRGGGAVFSNKAPLALPAGEPASVVLWENAASAGRVHYETTCGAGLPVISTLRNLLDSGDEIVEISGALSGTLGAIFADLSTGSLFSEAVRSAKEKGFTEPDPRDDLSGLDVARKALILARTLGMDIDLEDVPVESLVPEALGSVPIDAFLEQISGSDDAIAGRVDQARSRGAALKYVAQVRAGSGVTVGIQEAPGDTILGSLQGPENIIAFRTARYDEFPLTVTGPGAGAQVTAAGVASDILSLALTMRGA